LNPNAIAFFALVFFVMCFVALGSDYDFSVFGMRGTAFDRNHYRFVHFVADNYANSFFDCHLGLLTFQLSFTFYGQKLREAVLKMFELMGFIELTSPLLHSELK
jgi:hypothetical protein